LPESNSSYIWAQRLHCVPNRENTSMRNQLQAGFLTCALPRSSFPSTNIFIKDSGTNASRTSDLYRSRRSQRRDRRGFFTAFPFDYPKAYSFETCSQTISFSKNLSDIISTHLPTVKQKRKLFYQLIQNAPLRHQDDNLSRFCGGSGPLYLRHHRLVSPHIQFDAA